jgi:hypothetical protein
MRQVAAMIRDVKVLDGPMNVRWVFQDAIRSASPPFIFYGGHGDDKMLVGEDVILGMLTTEDVDRNPWLVRDKIVVAVPACFSAKALGPECIKMGARAYIGAIDSMYAAFDDEDHDYFQDWLDYHKALYSALLEGKTVREAVERYKEKARYYANLYREHLGIWKEADWHWETINHNIRVVTIFGDPSARIS